MILGRLDETYPMVELDQPVDLPTGNSLWSVPLETQLWGGTSKASHSLLERQHSLLPCLGYRSWMTSKRGSCGGKWLLGSRHTPLFFRVDVLINIGYPLEAQPCLNIIT